MEGVRQPEVSPVRIVFIRQRVAEPGAVQYNIDPTQNGISKADVGFRVLRLFNSRMQPQSDAELLRDYASHGAESAFNALVQRHTNLVYSAALRQTSSQQNAADVAQLVFVALLRNAKPLARTLDHHASIAGWLCRTARNISLNMVRTDSRRRSRETEAMQDFNPTNQSNADWDALGPVLDEALAELSESDQEAVVLRFFKSHDLESIGRSLGVSADAAQKRVARALEKLRALLNRRGVTTSTASLAVALSTGGVQCAPAGLAGTISTAALVGTALNTSLIGGAMKVTTMTLMQKSVVATIIAAALGTIAIETLQVSRLRERNQTLAAQQDAIRSERDAAVSQVAVLESQINAPPKIQVSPVRTIPSDTWESGEAGPQPTPDELAVMSELAGRARAGEYVLQSENPFAVRRQREALKKTLEYAVPPILKAREKFLADLNVAPETILKLTNVVAKIAETSAAILPSLDEINRAKIEYDDRARRLLTPEQNAKLKEFEIKEALAAEWKQYGATNLDSFSAADLKAITRSLEELGIREHSSSSMLPSEPDPTSGNWISAPDFNATEIAKLKIARADAAAVDLAAIAERNQLTEPARKTVAAVIQSRRKSLREQLENMIRSEAESTTRWRAMVERHQESMKKAQ